MNANSTDVVAFEELGTAAAVEPPRGYKILTALNLIFHSISVLLCIILILSTTLPLWNEQRRAKYSRFNLYLAYLAVPDLVLNAYFIKVIVRHTTLFVDPATSDADPYPRMEHDPYDFKVQNTCMAANMYLNAFLAYEIYKLLEKSQARKRYHPPTIAKATVHAMVSYGIGVGLSVINVFKLKTFERHWKIISGFELAICVVLPILWMIGLTCCIHKKGLLTATKSMHQGRLRILTLYFMRIIGVYFLAAVPLILVYVVGIQAFYDQKDRDIAYGIAMLIAGSQVPVSFACSLTKPDARKLIASFLDCGCGFSKRNSNEKEAVSQEEGQASSFQDPYLRRRTTVVVVGSTMVIGSIRTIENSIPVLGIPIDLSSSLSTDSENANTMSPFEDDGEKSTSIDHRDDLDTGAQIKDEQTDKVAEGDIETGTTDVSATTSISSEIVSTQYPSQ